jgi:hypothetical protein
LTLELEQAAVPATRPRRAGLLWVAGGLLIVIVAALVVGAVLDTTYMPLAPGGETGPAIETSAHLAQISDGIQTTEWVVTGPVGTQATVAYRLVNNGRVGVTLDGLAGSHLVGYVGSATAPHSALFMSLHWSPTVHGSFQWPMPIRAFPAHLAAGGSIAIDVTVTKPACPSGQSAAVTDIPIRWSALGLHHTYDLPLQLGGDYLPIESCPTRAALAHSTFTTR